MIKDIDNIKRLKTDFFETENIPVLTEHYNGYVEYCTDVPHKCKIGYCDVQIMFTIVYDCHFGEHTLYLNVYSADADIREDEDMQIVLPERSFEFES